MNFWINPLTVELWEITVTDSIIAAAHGEFTTIKELYVPSLNLCINSHSADKKGFNKFIATREERYDHTGRNTFLGEKTPSLLKSFSVYGKKAECLRTIRKLIDEEETYRNIIGDLLLDNRNQ
jgi:hypothetical protein